MNIYTWLGFACLAAALGVALWHDPREDSSHDDLPFLRVEGGEIQ